MRQHIIGDLLPLPFRGIQMQPFEKAAESRALGRFDLSRHLFGVRPRRYDGP